jgi:hypothetical protein
MLAALALVVVTASGCVVHDHDDGYYDDGRGQGSLFLNVTWEIDGSVDPALCAEGAVDYAYILVEDDLGFVNDATLDCGYFSADLELPSGDYWVTVQLFDSTGRARTTALTTDVIRLYRDDAVIVNFPLDSFYY